MQIARSSMPLSHTHTLFIRRHFVHNMASAAVDDAKHGFSRPEMYKDNLAGTVDAHDRHVFLCYKNHLNWPPRVVASDADPLPKRVASAWKARKKEFPLKTKVTVCEAREEAGFSNGDVLIFPDMIKYRGLEEWNVEKFIDEVMVSGKAWDGKAAEVLGGKYIFVCAHGSRDVRCGVCGPLLIEKLNHEIQLRGLKDEITVMASSHIGGHKYAGNLIIYSPAPHGKNIMGHWYGYVTPDDIPALLDQHIAKGEIIQRLWRGQMGSPAVKGGDDKNFANRDDTSSKAKKNEAESNDLRNNENMSGCCQGVNGVSCCRISSFEKNKGNTDNKISKEANENKIISWSWPTPVLLQQHGVLTAAGLLGALAAVAVACRFYRRSA